MFIGLFVVMTIMAIYCAVVADVRNNGLFGRFDLAALGGCHTLNVCYVLFDPT